LKESQKREVTRSGKKGDEGDLELKAERVQSIYEEEQDLVRLLLMTRIGLLFRREAGSEGRVEGFTEMEFQKEKEQNFRQVTKLLPPSITVATRDAGTRTTTGGEKKAS